MLQQGLDAVSLAESMVVLLQLIAAQLFPGGLPGRIARPAHSQPRLVLVTHGQAVGSRIAIG
jgi:hypothetical protein